ncbi:MAG: RloB family protein [Bacteroidales bacterium]|nr:RloB family protein [Bacteroidales bacterium]
MARKKNSPIINKGIAFIADGESEQWYISQIKKYYNKTMSLNQLPKTKNIQEQYDLVNNLFREGVYDKIIWIIDFDQVIKENNDVKNTKSQGQPLTKFLNIYKAINNSEWNKDEKVTIIINNPCLEFWYLLHKKLSYKYYRNYVELIPDLKKFKVDNQLFEKYKKNKDDYKNLFEKLLPYLKKMDFSKLKAFDINKCESESCSEMYKLFEVLDININNDNI